MQNTSRSMGLAIHDIICITIFINYKHTSSADCGELHTPISCEVEHTPGGSV